MWQHGQAVENEFRKQLCKLAEAQQENKRLGLYDAHIQRKESDLLSRKGFLVSHEASQARQGSEGARFREWRTPREAQKGKFVQKMSETKKRVRCVERYLEEHAALCHTPVAIRRVQDMEEAGGGARDDALRATVGGVCVRARVAHELSKRA